MRTSLLTAFFLTVGSAVSAATVTFTGDAQFAIAPSDVSDATQTSVPFGQDAKLTIFEEQQDLLLTSAISLDNGAIIGAGEIVSSFMIFLNGLNTISASAVFDFSSEILGIVTQPGHLNASFNSVLQADGSTYGTLDGLEYGIYSSDSVSIGGTSGSTLSVHLGVADGGAAGTAGEYGDWMRVIVRGDDPSAVQTDRDNLTALPSVPLPASGILGLFGIAAFAAFGRRKA